MITCNPQTLFFLQCRYYFMRKNKYLLFSLLAWMYNVTVTKIRKKSELVSLLVRLLLPIITIENVFIIITLFFNSIDYAFHDVMFFTGFRTQNRPSICIKLVNMSHRILLVYNLLMFPNNISCSKRNRNLDRNIYSINNSYMIIFLCENNNSSRCTLYFKCDITRLLFV